MPWVRRMQRAQKGIGLNRNTNIGGGRRLSDGRKRWHDEVERLGSKYRSTTHYVLSGLVPYTEANMKLSFKPHAYFNDLEKLAAYKAKHGTIRMSYYRAVRRGLVVLGEDGSPRLTEKGLAQLKRYEPKKLRGAASILVIFDIPEHERQQRQKLRVILRELRFVQVQKSVWQTEYDVLDYLVPELQKQHLHEYVQVYESARIV